MFKSLFNLFSNKKTQRNVYGYNDDNEPQTVRPSFIKGTAVILIVLLLLPVLFFSFTEPVRPGYAGILLSWNGGIKERVLDAGRSWVWPWENVKEYPVSTETVVYDLAINNKDGKPITVKLSINYSMNKEMLPHIYTRFRGQSAETIETTFMKTNILGLLNNISSNYSMMQIVNERQKINLQLLPALQRSFGDEGIDISEAQIIDAPPDPETQKILQAVVNAQNYEKQMQFEKAAAIAAADKQIEIARGDANAKRMAADAQAYANRVIAESVTPQLTEYTYAQAFKENIKALPTTLIVNGSGTSNGMMLNLGLGK